MTDAELQQEIENYTDSNLLLRLENDVYERYLARKEPDSLQSNSFIQSIFISNFPVNVASLH